LEDFSASIGGAFDFDAALTRRAVDRSHHLLPSAPPIAESVTVILGWTGHGPLTLSHVSASFVPIQE
jgi:hypothetical protein